MTTMLKQSTAAILKLGPFIDSTDGVTPETGLTIAQADIQISKAGAAFAKTSAASPTTTHDAEGWYPVPLTATDTGTLGMIAVQVNMSGALPVWLHAMVVPSNVWDSLFGADLLQVDTTQIEGSDATDQINAAAYTALTDYDAPTKAELDSGLAALNDPTAAAVADAVWDEAVAGHVAGGSFGEEVQLHALSSEVSALNDPTAAAIADQVWGEALSGHTTAGTAGKALSDAASGSLVGPGATSYVIAVDDGASPVQGADVWVSTDADGASVVAGPLQTDSWAK